MASLHFKGKSAVWNHHLSVPYHTFEKDKKASLVGNDDSENLIIEGDNLLALKALLPKYQGKVKCIYIDPPYNTGNENWIYNDNVNNPLIKTWIGQVVGKEGEDFTRHDKWLCMMAPRLKLLRELLTEDGVIFVSIDDNEVHHLRCLLDEVFGGGNFIGNIAWESKTKSQNTESAFNKLQPKIEHILVYTKNDGRRFNLINKGTKEYPLNDEQGAYREYPLEVMNANGVRGRKSMVYEIQGILPPAGKQWQLGLDQVATLKSSGNLFVRDGKVIIKMRPDYEKSELTEPFWAFFSKEIGTAESAKKELTELLGVENAFDTVKPVELVKRLIFHVTQKDDLVLDSFAGSGTTAHAVIELNGEDSGNRKFILVEMENYAKSLTAERVKKAVEYEKSKAGFTYFKLGSPIDAENILSGNLPSYNEFAKYVYYLATGNALEAESKIKQKDYFVGKQNGESVYLLYNNDIEELKKLAITLDWAKKAHEKDGGRKVVYAPACYLDEEYLAQFNIIFVGIPYNLFERA